MVETVTATLVVGFPSAAALSGTGLLSIEIDARDGGLNDGNTVFNPGDSIGYLVYAGDSVTNLRHFSSVSSSSSITSSGGGTRSIDESLIFANTASQTVKFPIKLSDGIASTWLGDNNGPIVLEGQNTLVASDGNAVGVLDVSYNTVFTQHTLNNTPSTVNGESEYTLIIVVVGDIIGT